MKNFRLISHTADVKINSEADSLDELFSASLEGLCEVMYPNFKKDIKNFNFLKKINVKSIDLSALLVDFLSEALYLMNFHKVLLYDMKFIKLTHNNLKAVLSGWQIEEFSEDVKAVTYHDAVVKQNIKGEWESMILLDI